MKKAQYIFCITAFLAGCGGIAVREDAPAAVRETDEAPEVVEEQPAQEAKSEKVEELIGLLGHKEYRVREKASAELLGLGIHALAQLEAAARSDDIEVKLRASALRDAIKEAVEGGSPLFLDALEKGNAVVVKEIVSRNITYLNVTNEMGQTFLHLASRKGYGEIVGILLEAGADANARDEFGDTPVHEAVYWRKKGVVDILLGKGADINSRNVFGHTPLDEVYNKDEEIITFLRKRGAKKASELKSEEK